MGFHEVQMPTGISYGASGGPGYFTQVIQTDGGREERIARREVAQRRWTIGKLKTAADVDLMLQFFVAREGAQHGFRFQDPFDFSTGVTPFRESTYAADDVEVGVGDGSETAFQLVKKYTNGGVTKTRNITKPQTGKVTVEVNGAGVTLGVDYSLDTTTGVVTFGVAPTSGHSITAGFQFDTPARFSSETDQVFELEASYFETNRLSLGLVEIIGETNVDDDFNFGGALDLQFEVNTTISHLTARLIIGATDSTGLHLALQDPTNFAGGGPYFAIVNEGVEDFDLKDHDAVTLVTLTNGDAVEVWLAEDAAGDKIWYAW